MEEVPTLIVNQVNQDMDMDLDQKTIKRIEERAAQLGLTPEQYVSIAEENFWQDEQFLTCAKCGHRVLIDEAGLGPAHQQDSCPNCGSPDEEAFGLAESDFFTLE